MPPQTMQAMVLDRAGTPLQAVELPVPAPGPHQVLIKVAACGVCRTDLHVFDGELNQPKLPLVLGHEIIGHVEALGKDVEGFAVGERVGVPWLGFTDGTCFYCRAGRENLCDHPLLHRLSDRRRLRPIHGGRCALRLSHSRRL